MSTCPFHWLTIADRLRVDNIDYNEIKHLIKLRTTKSQGVAISIPGRNGENEALGAFEQELYAELVAQHQRINLFVKSKSGEIQRRLDHLHRQVVCLTQQSQAASQKRISVRRLERFSKAETEVLKAGDEVQSLARFVGAQRLAFFKLLKKYQKWTGSSNLQKRFQADVLNSPHNFSPKDFGPLLEQWTDVLATVRAPFETELSWKANPNTGRNDSSSLAGSSSKGFSDSRIDPVGSEKSVPSAAELDNVYRNGSDVEVDTAFVTVPLGKAAGKAAFWVHADNIIQLHILLLQHTRLRRRSIELRPDQSPPSSRGSIQSLSENRLLAIDDEVTTIICDDLQDFGQRRNGITISDIETSPGGILEEAAISIRYTHKSEAIVAISDCKAKQNKSSNYTVGNQFLKARLKRKAIDRLFLDDDSPILPPQIIPISEETSVAKVADVDMVRQWLSIHRSVQPLVQLRSTRTRFVGLGNSSTKGVWAILDRDVHIKRWSREDLQELSQASASNKSTSVSFPYAVLEVRWEGGTQPELVQALDATHLTERVRGFSLEVHAVVTVCKPPNMATPLWLPILGRDIRKVPTQKRLTLPQRASVAFKDRPQSPNDGLTSASSASITDVNSSSGFSAVPQSESPATSVHDQLQADTFKAFKKNRPSRAERSLNRQKPRSNSLHQRYWNEFDDGDEATPDEAYTIFVNPNTSNTFPGAATFSKLTNAIVTISKPLVEKVRSLLNFSPPATATTPNEQQSLMADYFAQRPTAEDSDLDSDNSSAENFPRSRLYSTFPGVVHHSTVPNAVASRDLLLFRCCIASFLASLILLAIASVLTLTTRRRYALTADVGALIGVASSLVFGTAGTGMMVARKEVGWIERAIVLLVFGGVCIGNAGLIGFVVGKRL